MKILIAVSLLALTGCASSGPTVRETMAYQQTLIDRWESKPLPNTISPQMVRHLKHRAYAHPKR